MARKKADPAYLHIPKDTPIEDFYLEIFSGACLPEEREQEILDQLVDKGVHTYGQYVRFCMTKWLDNEIPGLELQAMQTMYKFALHSENTSKEELVEKYNKAQEEIARLKQSIQQPTEQLAAEAAAKGREGSKGEETARSM